ncbi:MAG TPA: lysylphosphatidylglycerol synthase domain-containing protein [Rhizobium sp.]
MATLALSIWLLCRELHALSIEDLRQSLSAIKPHAWAASVGAAFAAYAFLAAYDHLGLRHLGKRIDPVFVTICAAATYAFSHTIGASIFSGAVLRYRAYTSKGLNGTDVAALVGFCTFSFVLGVAIVLGVIFIADPFIIDRFVDVFPLDISSAPGRILVGSAAIYLICSLLPFRGVRLGSFTFAYPSFTTALLQIVVAAAELVCAAMVLYFALPAAGNPGLMTVTGVFVLSFCAAMISHSPGGLGVLELLVLTGLPEMAMPDVLAALLVFRLFYFIFPLIAITVFEIRRQEPRSHRT